MQPFVCVVGVLTISVVVKEVDAADDDDDKCMYSLLKEDSKCFSC